MLIDAATVNAMTRFPWTLAPAVAIFLVVLTANVVLASDNSDKIGPGVANNLSDRFGNPHVN